MSFLDQSFSIAQAAAQNRREKIREKRLASGRQRTARPLKFPSLLSVLPPVIASQDSDDEQEDAMLFTNTNTRPSMPRKSLASEFENVATAERRKSVRFSNRLDDSMMITEADEDTEPAASTRKSGRKSGAHLRDEDSFGGFSSSSDSSSSGFAFHQRTPRKSTTAPAAELADDDSFQYTEDNENNSISTEEPLQDQGESHNSQADTENENAMEEINDQDEQPVRRPKKKSSNRRRATQKIIDNAKQYRIVIDDDDEEQPAHSAANGGVMDASDSVHLGGGRPKRFRIPPLEWWNNEEVVYQRKHLGVGVVVPVVAALKLGDGRQVSVDKLIEAQQQRSGKTKDRRISVATLKRPYSDTVDYTKLGKKKPAVPTATASPSKAQSKRQEKLAAHQEEAEEPLSDSEMPLSPNFSGVQEQAQRKKARGADSSFSPFPKPPSDVFAVLVPNSETKSLEEKVLVKPICYDHLEELRQEAESQELNSTTPNAKGKKKAPAPSPQGAKLFEESCFSTGELLLPPLACKQREMAVENFEVFTVLECEPNCVEVEYADSGKTVLLQVGHQFQIPPDATYSLKNLSRRQSAKLTFTLIRQQKAVDETEMQQRINQAVEARIKQMQAQLAEQQRAPPSPVEVKPSTKTKNQRKR